ncbi:MAG: ferritin-like domain-containing protein [Proteobacteria bacterium]|nr:ferritin-like domain-containing protein [Pseudomonadota bacterium]MCZ6782608.1 ferritin-like domain-containing protein [Pseudomonadota bacterium]
MGKILSGQRKQWGDFEVVDFVDEQEIQRLRDQLDVDTPMNVHWTWEYGEEVAELRRLYEKGKVNQWNAETDLDWSAPVSKDEWVLTPETSMLAQITKMMGQDEATQKAAAFDELNFSISQLLHGEQAALQICGQLTNVCEQMDQKWYAASQVADEARHVEVFAKFLSRKMGTIYPIGATLKVLLDLLLEAEGMNRKVLGMQTLFEGMAVGIMDMMRHDSKNPFFSDLLRRVEQDESRHAAFGVLAMRRIVREAEPEEMDEMEDWAFNILETLNANQQLDMLRLLGPKYGIDPESTVRMATTMPNFAEFNSMVYMHTVVPNLVKLGLITERTRDDWKRLGMMTDMRAEARSTLPEVD